MRSGEQTATSWVAVLLAFGFVAIPVPAQSSGDGGTRSVFSEMSGGRGRAMGGAYAALVSDASSVDWNPGGLAFAQRRGALVLQSNYYGLQIGEEYAAFVWPDWRWGVGAISVQHFGVDGIEGRDDRNSVTEAEFGSSQTQISLGYGRQVGHGWGIGGTFRLQRYQVADAKATGLAFDVGTQLSPGVLLGWSHGFWERMTIGVTARNLMEPEIRLDRDVTRDPGTWRFGTAYVHPFGTSGQLTAAVDVERSRVLDSRIHAGVELQFHPSFALRSGLTRGYPTMGAGFRWRNLALDYALESNPVGDVHRVGLSYEFGTTLEQDRLSHFSAEEARMQSRLEDAFEKRQAGRVDQLLADARSSLESGDALAALQSLAIVETLIPDDPRRVSLVLKAWMLQGRDLETDQKFSEAALAYNRVLAIDPQFGDAGVAHARAQEQSDLRARRSRKVRTIFAEALDTFSRGNLVQARRQFDEVLKLDPKDKDARAMRDRTRAAIRREVDEKATQAEQFLRAGLLSDATSLVRQIQGLEPENAEIPRLVERIAARRSQARPVAIADVNTEATRLTRKGASSLGSEAGSSEFAGSAKTHRQPVAKKRLSAEEREELQKLYDLGVAASQRQRSEDAVRYFEHVYYSDPSFPGVIEALKRECLVIGMDHFASSRLDEAIVVWQRALEVDPNDEKVRGYLKRALQNRTRTKELLRDSQ